jgi:hypothetical protein
MGILRRTSEEPGDHVLVPDDPSSLLPDARRDGLDHCQTIAIDAAISHAGNQQVVDLARIVAGSETVDRARTAATRWLARSKTNRALQDLALDVIDRLRGL